MSLRIHFHPCHEDSFKYYISLALLLVGICVPTNIDARATLGIRLALRTSEEPCNFQSVTLLSTGEVVYLKEVTSAIFHSRVIDSQTSTPQTCLYQEMFVNQSRMVSLSTVNNTFNAFIVLVNESFYIDGGNISAALEGIELTPFEELKKDNSAVGVCGVSPNAPTVVEALTDSKVSFFNTSITDYYVELYVVADYAMFQRWGSATESTVYQVVNYVNAMYRGQGIHIYVVALEVWKNGNPFSVVTNSATTLSSLAAYRTTLTTKHDVIHLISGITFDSGVLGLAYVGGMCRFIYSAGLSMDRTATSPTFTASTMTHEMGHNFGLSHDTTGCTCSPDPYCIMNAYSYPSSISLKWSTCSQNAFNINLPLLQAAKCLQNIPNLQTIKNSNLCGNGVIDVNEDCDPGLMNSNSPCCNTTTCKFTVGSQCAYGRCCNSATCQILPEATQCRKALTQCDLPEYCDGVSSFCPDDRYKMNAISCDNSQGYCYNGGCSSQNLQCQSVLSATSRASTDQCYQLNAASGSGYHGFCKYSFAAFSGTSLSYFFTSCSSGNRNCGLLQCTGYTSNPIFSGYQKIVNGEVCYHSLFDTNLTGVRDPAMVPDGSKCDTNQWCVNSICQSTPSLPSSCSCSGHGVCNDLGNCHCDNGFSGEDCSTPSGCGGSVDSGPPCPKMLDSQTTKNIIIGVVVSIIILLVIIGLIAWKMNWFTSPPCISTRPTPKTVAPAPFQQSNRPEYSVYVIDGSSRPLPSPDVPNNVSKAPYEDIYENLH